MKTSVKTIAISTLCLGTMLQLALATTVFTEDFTGDTSLGSAFTSTVNTGVTTAVSTTEGYTAPSAVLSDTSTANAGTLSVTGNNWSTFNTSTGAEKTFQVSFDWKVASSFSSAASTMRFNIVLGGTTPTTVNIGFGHSTIGGTDTNYFYAAGGSTGVTPSATYAIGYNGTSFENGFNFGTYSSSTDTNNSTNGNYYHFLLSYEDQATTALLTVTNNADLSQTTTYTITGLTATSVANTSGRLIALLSGNGGTGVSYIDNLNVSVVPEPSAFALVSLGGTALLALHKRRSR
ncbi:MAG: hypothetical protein B9S32_03675 [Verrucomicrobia bacterium Tous-C9LFEB]|nr:MAG: hypothetical protein B9S32_03675 [Verrucomicrobia bacterium Tous-C9LFEB]